MVLILPVFGPLVNWDLSSIRGEKHGEVAVNSWWFAGESVVAMHSKVDVHYLGLELSEFPILRWREPQNKATCCV